MSNESNTLDTTSEFERLRVEQSRKNGESQDEFLERYVGLTDEMISAIENFDIDEDGNPVPADYVIFLDKSARPLAWMTRELWPHLANKAEDGTPDPMPEMRFLNIDRLPWRIDPAVEISTHPSNFREPSEADIRGLRAIFAPPNKKATDTSPLDGKRILIIDEVSDSGDTMLVSTKLVERAFPTSKIKGHNWMDDYRVGPQGEKIVLDVPVWYESEEQTGRGVMGQLTDNSPLANKKSNLLPESHQFLSTRPSLPEVSSDGEIMVTSVDKRALALRRDAAKLAVKFASGDLVPIPNANRETYQGVPVNTYGVRRQEVLATRTKSKPKLISSNR